MSADPKPTTALEIAVLCQALPIQQAADLIEQYARTVASGARIEAAREASERFNRLMRKSIESPLVVRHA